MLIYRKGFYMIMKMTMALVVFAVLFASGVYMGSNTINNYRASVMRREATAIDHALDLYSRAHSGVNTVSITDKRKIAYTRKNIYPATLDELGVVQKDGEAGFGYLSSLIKVADEDASGNLDTSSGRFDYQPIKDDEDGTYSSYILKVKLPDGYLYTSPGSKTEETTTK